jgi:hypothetical protein
MSLVILTLAGTVGLIIATASISYALGVFIERRRRPPLRDKIIIPIDSRDAHRFVFNWRDILDVRVTMEPSGGPRLPVWEITVRVIDGKIDEDDPFAGVLKP